MCDEFESEIEIYIDKLEKGVVSIEEARNLIKSIVDLYKKYIPNIDKNLVSRRYIGSGNDIEEFESDFKLLIERLKIYLNKRKGEKVSVINNNTASISNSGNSINNNTNTVKANFDIKEELDKARKKVEENEYLDDDAKAEINEQLDKIDEVMSEDSKNNDKWKKLKGVISWISTKTYKIGEMVMPIITKALFPDVEQ